MSPDSISTICTGSEATIHIGLSLGKQSYPYYNTSVPCPNCGVENECTFQLGSGLLTRTIGVYFLVGEIGVRVCLGMLY